MDGSQGQHQTDVTILPRDAQSLVPGNFTMVAYICLLFPLPFRPIPLAEFQQTTRTRAILHCYMDAKHEHETVLVVAPPFCTSRLLISSTTPIRFRRVLRHKVPTAPNYH